MRHSSTDIARTVSLFFAVRRMMRTTIARGATVDPATWLRVETLKFIADNEQPKMKDVAVYLSITAPSATALVSGLIKSGHVSRVADPLDKRASRLQLTPAGKRELKKVIAQSVRMLHKLFTVLSARELAVFTETLERLRAGE